MVVQLFRLALSVAFPACRCSWKQAYDLHLRQQPLGRQAQTFQVASADCCDDLFTLLSQLKPKDPGRQHLQRSVLTKLISFSKGKLLVANPTISKKCDKDGLLLGLPHDKLSGMIKIESHMVGQWDGL